MLNAHTNTHMMSCWRTRVGRGVNINIHARLTEKHTRTHKTIDGVGVLVVHEKFTMCVLYAFQLVREFELLCISSKLNNNNNTNAIIIALRTTFRRGALWLMFLRQAHAHK